MIWYGRLYTFADSQGKGSCPPNACCEAGGKEGFNNMSSRITKCLAMIAILCVLATAFAVPLASAASYSKIYGRTQDKVRVRDSASTNATIIDNIVKDACVYVISSKTSGSSTFVQVKYRSSDGDVETGWVCQSDASTTYIKILSAAQAEDAFSVSGGNLPSRRVGTFSDAQREASQKNSDNTYVKEGTNGSVVKDIQTKLKAMGLYSGSITGNVGPKTKQAIKDFQDKYDLTVDGVAGPQTIAKIDAVYSASGSSSSASSSSSSSTSSGSVMKKDSNGANVRDLQTDLTTLGYYWAEITGNFGSKTEAAVKLFQKAHGLNQDGVAGKKTLDAIAAAIAKKGGTSSSSSSASSSVSSGSALKLDSQGVKVTQLQQDLKQLGYYYADITGNFGTKTEAAVKAFQKAYKLNDDGVAGASTLNAIAAAIEKAGGSLTSTSASGMKLGSTGSDVRALQQNLTTLGFYYGDVTGHYGTMTQAAVQKFQKSRGLTQDGVAGSKTVVAIASAIKSSGGSVADSTVSGVASSLREGDTGAAVTELQTMLKSLEYYYGEITGHYGSLTKKAVRSFQDDEDLTVDGIAGVNTINKLRKLTGTSSSSSSSGSAGATVTTSSSYGRIVKDNVNLRASYSTTSAAKASLDEGEKCRITKKYTVGSETWYYITVSDGKYTHAGYVRSDMVELISESDYGSGSDDSASGDNETLGMIRVTGNNVALRNGPGTSYSKAGTAGTGDVFYYIDTEDGWFRTRSGYWISRDYAKVMTSDEIGDYVGSGSGSSSSGSSSGPYKYGSTGSDVLYIQTALKKLGYYNGSLTGHYGNKTAQAVMDFQRDNSLSADGVTGTKTMAAIRDEYNKELSGGSSSSGSSSSGSGSSSSGVSLYSTVYDLSWDDYKRAYVRAGLSRGNTFKLTDLKTGKTFKVYVQSAGYHADVEPATASDTATMCNIYGVSSASKINYVRRSMLATIGNYQFACSVYGEAHGSEVITNNNYDGQFCVHFRDCKTSGTQVVREENQTPIDQAVTYVKAKGSKVETTPPSALR